MAIRFAAKDDTKGTPAASVSPAGTAGAAGVELSGRGGSVGATDETPTFSGIGADLFSAEPAPPRKRRKK
jgi:hypothetical protein